jgi:hypothetical protein
MPRPTHRCVPARRISQLDCNFACGPLCGNKCTQCCMNATKPPPPPPPPAVEPSATCAGFSGVWTDAANPSNPRTPRHPVTFVQDGCVGSASGASDAFDFTVVNNTLTRSGRRKLQGKLVPGQAMDLLQWYDPAGQIRELDIWSRKH